MKAFRTLFFCVLSVFPAVCFASARDRIKEQIALGQFSSLQSLHPSLFREPDVAMERTVRALEDRLGSTFRRVSGETFVVRQKARVSAIDFEDNPIVGSIQDMALDLRGEIREWKNGREVMLFGKYPANVSIKSGLAWRINDRWHLVLPRVKSRAIGAAALVRF